MKKLLSFVIIFAFCLTVLLGCGEDVPEAIPEVDEKGPYYRVEYVGDGEFVAHGNGDMILVKYEGASQFEEYDTVVIEFDESDLKKETGSRSYYEDHEITYHYVLENPKLVRPVGPGEPTFA